MRGGPFLLLRRFYRETGAFVLGVRRAAVEGGRRWPCGDAPAFCGEGAEDAAA